MIDSRPSHDGSPGTTPATKDGPAHPSPDALTTVRPLRLDQVRLDPAGLLGGWQERNAHATLPHCIEQLHHAGALDNMRRVVGETDAEYVGMWFADTDIYKTLEATAWELSRRRDDPRLLEFLDRTVALLAKAQDEDGYLDSYYQVDRREQQWRQLRWGHELYCAGHLIQAAVAAARAGVSDQLVAVARRFADLLVRRFGPGGQDAVCGHPEIETALVELYRVTGHQPYLELATKFIDLRGRGHLDPDQLGPQYYQDHLPVRDAPEVTGHAVRQLYLLSGAVDVAVETGDTALLAATRRLWTSAFTAKTYLTGAHGSRHRDEAFGDPYELPPDRAYGETCAAIANFQWNWRLLLATGEARYADELERVLYNAIAGSTALDGRHFFYSNPLQVRSGHDGSHEDASSKRRPWYSCSCCPPNLARLMASLHGYLASTDDSGIQVHLYGSASITGDVHGQPAEVTIRGAYPFDGRIVLDVRADTSRPWTLSLRIPGWCEDYRIDVDGVPVQQPARDGYLRLNRDWSSATVVLELSMPPRLIAAHPYVDAARGCLALMRGPLVYCLEQVDLPAGVVLEDVRLDPVEAPRAAATSFAGWPAGALAIAAGGRVRRFAPAPLYHDGRRPRSDAEATPVELVAVPYFLWGNRTAGPMRVWIPTDAADRPSPVDGER